MELNLIVKKELRKQVAQQVEVLDKVKNLFLMPKLDVLTTQQVADYYEVDLEAIQSCYRRNKAEIDSDGVSVEYVTPIIPGKIKCMFSRRAILRIGMFLEGDKIAKEIRTQILNAFEYTTDEQKVWDINEETSILLNLTRALTIGKLEDYIDVSKDYFDLQNRNVTV